MRICARLVLVAVALSAGFALAGCDAIDDLTAMFDTKRRLPGQRQPVFPEGVPGITPGIPEQYIRQPAEPALEPPETGELTAPTDTAAPRTGPVPQNAARPTAPPAEDTRSQTRRQAAPPPEPRRPRTATVPQRQVVPAQPLRPRQSQAVAAPPPSAAPPSAPPQPTSRQTAPQGSPSPLLPWPTSPPAGTFSR